jgi:hypothetical protein
MDEPETVATHAWRAQSFGPLKAAEIRDPIVEPLWAGDRVLVIVTAADATPRVLDARGEPLEDPQLGPIVAELASMLLAETVVLDGYLTRQPNVDRELAATMGPRIPTHGEVMRQFFVGGSSSRLTRAMGEDDAPPIDPDLPLTFVAVDLLSIDDQALLDVPLLERKRILETAFVEAELVRRSAFVRPPVGPWLISWRAFGFTEIAYKDANSRYTLGRPNPGWAVATIPIR